MSGGPDGRPVILYDADCGFCRWTLAKLLAWDRGRRLRPLELQDPRASELLEDVPEERRMESWHLVTTEGRVESAGDALPALFRLLPGGGPLAAAAERAPGAARTLYRAVADRRSAFGRLVTGGARRRADARIRRRVDPAS